MYKSRKKIIIISSISTLFLGGLVAGAYFIATSFDTKEIKNKTESLYIGATSSLSNPFDINETDISLSDWIFLNMPKRINITKTLNEPTKKNYTIQFMDHTYDPVKNNPGNMICSINFNLVDNIFDYTITTATNLGGGVTPLLLGGLSFKRPQNDLITYNLTNYDSSVSILSLNKTNSGNLNYENFNTGLLNNSFSLERIAYIGTVAPASSDNIFEYKVKNDKDVITYNNTLIQPTQSSFRLIFSNPVYSTTLTSTIQLDDTTINNNHSYNLSYTGIINGINTIVNDYRAYEAFWNINELNSIKMPNIFGTIGMLDWISKL